ncbi:MAG TPA: 5-methyltetrahydropteroyltriglutamate--homocysteine methyltransferase [Gammaproteobacteria bacterium]|nr:5-methyltetrahydropteroyltriglutamate--homocysteine methyltransferase [Gammaproteobacteria bacterium]
MILPTTVVGSYPQPDWLVDRAKLGAKVPRIRAPEIWRIDPAFLDAAQDAAVLLAVRDMERAGVDIVTDGEVRRESYSNLFATALEGVDADRPGTTLNRNGVPSLVPRIVGPLRRREPAEARGVAFLRRNTSKRIKVTLPGPFTLAQQAEDRYYGDDEALAMAFAAVVNEELHAVGAAGADVIQLDEPWLEARAERAVRYAVAAIDRALEGIAATTAVHVCFGYAAAVREKPAGYRFLPRLAEAATAQISIEAAQPKLDLGVLSELRGKTVVLGVLDLGTQKIETPEIVADRLRAALAYVAPERLIAAPDCGMKYLSRELAFRKLAAMTRGAAIVRRELAER